MIRGHVGHHNRESKIRLAHTVLIVGLVVYLMSNSACRRYTAHDSTSVGQPEQSLDSLRAIVLDIVGEPTCLSNVQCRYVPFGAKPCGGPWTYLVYSIQTTDSASLAETAADYTEREVQLNRELGRVSDCRAVSPPILDCVDSRCVAAQ